MQALGFLLMLLSGVAVLAGGGLVLYALRTRRPALARGVALFGLGWAALYLCLLAVASLTSEEHTLGLKERKAFCGFYLDCHLGVAVEEVRRAASVGEGARQVTADGVFYVVTVQVSSDARQAALRLVNPEATLLDARGNRYERSFSAELALAEMQGTPVTFGQRVPADASYTKTLVFDVPPGVEAPKLLITKGDAIERLTEFFLIGDEDSFLHRRTVFAL